MSRLPNIGETAIVEITYKNDVNDVADTEENSRYPDFHTGWSITSGFEIVDAGGVEYQPIYRTGTNELLAYKHSEFTPLDAGESKTHCIEVRAVSEGLGSVQGHGHYLSGGTIAVYIDNEETLLRGEHQARYPDMYERPTTATKFEEQTLLPPLTDEERKNVPVDELPSRELLIDFFAAYFADIDPDQKIGTSLDFVQQMSEIINLNMTDIRQILRDGGYTDAEIDAELSKRASEQP